MNPAFSETVCHKLKRRYFVARLKGMLLLLLIFFPMESYALGPGDKAPDFHIVTSEGKAVAYDRDLRGRKPVYLIFWAAW